MADTLSDTSLFGAALLDLDVKKIIAAIGLTSLDIEALRNLRLTDVAVTLAKEAAAKLESAASKEKKNGQLRDLSDVRNDTGVRMNPYLLNVKADWNCRDKDDIDNLHHMIGLAKGIAEVGVKNPITVAQDKSGRLYITDGHTRLAAVMVANNYFGASVINVPVILEDKYSSEADHILSQLVRNDGKKPSALERANVAKKLIDCGWNEDQIAKKTGYSTARVIQLLDIYTAPEAIKMMIRHRQVSSTTAMAILRESATHDEAVAKLTAAIGEATSKGKTKATARHLDPNKERAQSAKVFFKTTFDSALIDNSMDDKVVVTFSLDKFEEIREILGL